MCETRNAKLSRSPPRPQKRKLKTQGQMACSRRTPGGVPQCDLHGFAPRRSRGRRDAGAPARKPPPADKNKVASPMGIPRK